MGYVPRRGHREGSGSEERKDLRGVEYAGYGWIVGSMLTEDRSLRVEVRVDTKEEGFRVKGGSSGGLE